MTMTRRDFENLAKDLRWFKIAIWNDEPIDQAFDALIVQISDTCRTANPRFDRDRFQQTVGHIGSAKKEG